MRLLRPLTAILAVILLAATTQVALAYPSSTNYQLKAYGFGNGGTANSISTNYALNAITGEVGSPQSVSSSNYSISPGLNPTQNANVPQVTLTNPSSYYDKLLVVVDTQSNPTDTTYAIAISTDNFVTTNYIKSDNTVTSTLTFPTDYRTFAGWGSGSGTTIIGLAPNTTYKVKAKAYQGKFSESAYGPTSTASTVGQQLSLCVYTNANCGAGGSTEALTGLVVGNVTNSPTNIGVDFATNADNGGKVYLYANGAGLVSGGSSYTIASATADLGSGAVPEGFGGQVASVTQSSGGPLSSVSPYNNSVQNVGIIDTTIRELFTSANPLVGGTGAVTLKAKPSIAAPATNDYQDILTIVAAGNF